MSRDSIDYDKVPVATMVGSVKMYIEQGISGGGFLTALFENNLSSAFSNADNVNTEAMKEWTVFLFNYVPASCWGSKEKVQAWIKDGGITGRYKMKEVADV